MKLLRIISAAVTATAALAVTTLPVQAQCAMCKAVIENSPDAAAASKTLSFAALVLLVPPVTLFSGLFVAIYRLRNVNEKSIGSGGSS